MENDRLLISTAMLAALHAENNDNLSLLEIYVKVVISKTCSNINEKIDIENLISDLERDYAIKNLPRPIMIKILKRIAKSSSRFLSAKKVNNEDIFYYLGTTLEEVDAFMAREHQTKQKTEQLVSAIEKWINESNPKLKIKHEDVSKMIATFFTSNGFDILFEINEVRAKTVENSKAANYQIAKFVLDQIDSDGEFADTILDVAKGAVVSVAIFFSSEANRFKGGPPLANLTVYLDTTFLLFALGLKEEYQEKAAAAMLKLLRDNGAKLACFRQHFAEVYDIISVYKHKLEIKDYTGRTLEKFELFNTTIAEVGAYLDNLENEMKDRLGVDVLDLPAMTNSASNLHENRNVYYDVKGLTTYLSEAYQSYREKPIMCSNDVDAVAGIHMLRDGLTYELIEQCPAIWITTNNNLVNKINVFNNIEGRRNKGTSFGLAESDSEFTSILWLRYGTVANSDIPKLLLVKNAMAAITLTARAMELFRQKVGKMEADGKISAEKAASIRHNAYCAQQTFELAHGDETAITEEIILTADEKARKYYAGEADEKNRRLENEKKAEADKAKLANDRLADAKSRAFKAAKDNAKMNASKKAKRDDAIVKALWFIGVGSLTIANVYSIVSGSANTHLIMKIVLGLALVATVIGAISQQCKILFSKKFTERREKHYYDLAYAEEVKKWSQFGEKSKSCSFCSVCL